MNQLLRGWLLAILTTTLTPMLQAAPLQTAVVSYGELPREYRLDGVVEAVNQTTVSAQTSGQVEDILFDVDDYVEKGTVIVRLKDTEQQAGLKTAKAELNQTLARLKEATAEYHRTRKVFEKKLVSRAKMDKVSATLKAAQAKVDAASARYSQSKEQYEYTRVRAPYSGIVTHRYVEVGETAQPGQKLMSGISLEQLRVNVDVPQSVIPSIRQRGKARVKLPGNGWVDVRKITIFPFADFGSNTFKVRLDLPDDTPNLFPGMFVKTAFVTGMKKELMIPARAVVHRSEVTAVYVVDADQRLHFRHIRVGKASADGRITVLAGLDPGERVALDPIAAGVLLKQQRQEQGHG